MRKLVIGLTAMTFAWGVSYCALAQDQQQPTAAPAPAQQLLSADQLDQLVAPIALYPDTLLAQVLIASTYPLELVQADRWVSANKNLKGDALKAAADKQDWDESIKSLVATPSVLSTMSTQLDWTQKLGDAVLAQQPDVMDAIQRLRAKAQAQDKLQTTKQQTVSTQQQNGKQVIVITPTDRNTIYVPYYNPAVVYGAWPYPTYPAYYFPPPAGYIASAAIATGLAFGAGYAVGRWASGGYYWGGGVNWGGNNITVNRSINNINVNNWQHNSYHRRGVAYNNTNVQQRFGNNTIRNGSQARLDFRGRSGNQVLQPGAGGNRPNLGGGDNRPNLGGGGNRPNVGGGGNRPNVGGGGNRPNVGGGGNQANLGGGGNRPNVGGGGNRPNVGGGGNRPNVGGGGNRPNVGGGGNRPNVGGGGNRPNVGGGGNRPGGGVARPTRESGLGNMQPRNVAAMQSQRGRASVGGGGGGGHRGGGGGGGGHRGGGGGGGGHRGGGGGRRSDVRLKHDITIIGRLANGIGFYRFIYNGDDKVYVGVMAQEVQAVRPEAVVRGRDGYLRVFYEKLGLKFQTYDEWIASGAHVPIVTTH
jgi:uncharacterized protein DUF3300/endosialidase-like protein